MNRHIYPHQELSPGGEPAEPMRRGLTLREYYAGLAMQGLLMNPRFLFECADMVEQIAVIKADALIAELEKNNEPNV